MKTTVNTFRLKNRLQAYFLPNLLFTILLTVSCFSSASAQITVGQSDMPQPGDTVRLSTCNSNLNLPNPALTGTSYLWDFTKLTAFTQTIDTFLSVSSTPFAYQFSFNNALLYPKYKATVAQKGANLPALGPVTVTNVINYFKDQSANYESVGYGADINSVPTSVKDDTIDVMYTFPMNYGNSDSCNSSSHANIPGLGYYSNHQRRINHIDGWGTLKTPYGTFSVLRIATILYSYDSLNIDTPIHIGFSTPITEQLQYKWFGKGFALPLLQVNEQVVGGNPVFTNAVYRDSARKPLLSVKNLNENKEKVVLAPNPSDGRFTLFLKGSVENKYAVTVYDLKGREITAKYITGGSVAFDLTSEAPGTYIYFVKKLTGPGSESADWIGGGRFILSR